MVFNTRKNFLAFVMLFFICVNHYFKYQSFLSIRKSNDPILLNIHIRQQMNRFVRYLGIKCLMILDDSKQKIYYTSIMLYSLRIRFTEVCCTYILKLRAKSIKVSLWGVYIGTLCSAWLRIRIFYINCVCHWLFIYLLDIDKIIGLIAGAQILKKDFRLYSAYY